MKNTENKKLNKSGYTLIELLVVIAIIAIFTALSAVGLRVVQNRNVMKYSKMVNEVVSDFYKNATTKEGNWKMEMQLLNDGKTYRFAQYYEATEDEETVWKPYATHSLDGTIMYAVTEIAIDDCKCEFYKDKTLVPSSDHRQIKLYVSRERAVFDKTNSEVDTIVFTNGSKSSQVNIVLGTANNYTGSVR